MQHEAKEKIYDKLTVFFWDKTHLPLLEYDYKKKNTKHVSIEEWWNI
jgi:hypothetical protein